MCGKFDIYTEGDAGRNPQPDVVVETGKWECCRRSWDVQEEQVIGNGTEDYEINLGYVVILGNIDIK